MIVPERLSILSMKARDVQDANSNGILIIQRAEETTQARVPIPIMFLLLMEMERRYLMLHSRSQRQTVVLLVLHKR